jgi:DNA polymerase-4
MRRIFHIDLDAFFVAVEEVADASLRGKAVVVGGRGWRGVVACASYPARQYGIGAGMPLTQARRLCPHAVFVEGRFSRYRQASDAFFAILNDFTPFIEPVGIDEAYLDMTGFESLYGTPHRAAVLIKERVRRELGLAASVGIAASKVVAKVASGLSKPDGLIEVSPREEAAFLAPLPVGTLPGVGPRTVQALSRMGVDTVGGLASLPPSLLRYLFGSWGGLLRRHARGEDTSPVEPPAEAKSVSRSTTLDTDTRDRAFLEAVLAYLCERVGAELRRHGKLARCVTLRLRYSDFETLQHQSTLPQPTSHHQLLFEAGRALMDRLLPRRGLPVRLVGIGTSRLVSGRQLPLWPSTSGRLEPLNGAIDRLRGRYGFTAIQTGRTFSLGRTFPTEGNDYVLPTPALSR